MIIALAGHVDHGKTALIRALTGIDADRLPDEKRRGMTIDLGFAHLRLPDGGTLGFVDVPGHERFLGNMLAGVLSIDRVLLVVAADDGPMPQTLEHLAILRLTGVTDLTAVVTKIDRVDADRLDQVRRDISACLAHAGFPDAPIRSVSSLTGDGIDDLRADLIAKSAAAGDSPPSGGFRLPIDRAFTVAGAGLVVTGTIAAGTVSVGDRLVVSPSRLTARVRGIEVHHTARQTARAGDRCALAIAGPDVERAALSRGDWLIAPELHAPSRRIDVRLTASALRPLRHADHGMAHLGSTSVGARVLIVDGEAGLASLVLDRPVVALWGDRVVLRDTATGRIAAGGRVIDPFSPPRRTRREQRAVSLRAAMLDDPREALTELLAAEGWVDQSRFELARNLPNGSVRVDGAMRIGRASRPILISEATRRDIADALLKRLRAWHDRHPDRIGPDKAALLAGAAAWPVETAEAVLLELVAAGQILRGDAAWRLPDHNPTLAPSDEAHWTRIAALLVAADTRPPRVRELAEALALEPDAMEAVLIRLERFGRLLRVAPNRFFLPATVIALGEMARELAADGGFGAADFNRKSGIGRNLTIPVLEYLDKIGVTQRSGERRHVLRSAEEVLG